MTLHGRFDYSSNSPGLLSLMAESSHGMNEEVTQCTFSTNLKTT
jgi:hypothetical protein